MNKNIAVAPSQPWPGIRIHIMDIVQSPGIFIPPDIEVQQYTVAATLAAKAMLIAA